MGVLERIGLVVEVREWEQCGSSVGAVWEQCGSSSLVFEGTTYSDGATFFTQSTSGSSSGDCYTITMSDSYGDGWNGAQILVYASSLGSADCDDTNSSIYPGSGC